MFGFRSDRPDVLGPQRWLCPRQLSLIPGHSLGRIYLILHGHTPRLGYRADKHEPQVFASKSGRFSDEGGLRRWPGEKRPVAIDPQRRPRFRNNPTSCSLLVLGQSVRKGLKAMRAPTTLAAFAIILGATAISQAQPNAQDAVELSNGAKVPQTPSLPKLNLTQAA